MIRKIISKIKFGHKADSKSYVKYLMKKGLTIGENVVFFSPYDTHVDVQYPFLISIGNNVAIASGCRILTHDYSWSVIKRINGSILGSSGEVTIGDNVFIGSDTLILKNSKIGSNVIIGAGSLVSGTIPSGVVAVGRPAKAIMSIEEFIKKREQNQLQEAQHLFNCYVERYKVVPPKIIFREYFFLFEKEYQKLPNYFKDVFKRGGYSFLKHSIDSFSNNSPLFDNYESFLDYCKNKRNNGQH